MEIRKSKKGSVDDLAYLIYVFLGIALITLIFFKVGDDINTEIQDSDVFEDRGKTAGNQIVDIYTGTIDNSFLFLVIGMLIVAIVFAFLVAVHPIFFIFYIILLPIIIFIAGIVSNIYQQAASTAGLGSYADQLIMISHILQYLPFIVGFFGFVLAIVMYKTWREHSI